MVSQSKETASTPNRMIAEARSLFAERGFYGVSIAQIAAELGLTKQALLHHFGTKEKLYGLVLEQIAGELALLKPGSAAEADPATALCAYYDAMIARSPEQIERSRLLMREILDNRVRAESAGNWYLKPFLEDLTATLKAVPGWSSVSDARLLATTIQLLGAVNYHAVSRPTFAGIFGGEMVKASDGVFAAQLRVLVMATLETQTGNHT